METTQKRPRIRPDQAALIDSMRGKVAFEVEVQEIIDQFFGIFLADDNARAKPRWAKPDEVMLNLLRSDLFQFEGEPFRAAFDKAMEYHAARMIEFEEDRREEELIEPGIHD